MLQIEKDRLLLDGKPFYLACGDVQYFRIHPSEWRQRLEVMKDYGLTAIQTYTAWNLHEPRPGEFDFTGMLDIRRFLSICQELDLKVMFRPTPYICGEWEFGGLPYWLMKEPNFEVRCQNPAYMKATAAFLKRMCEEIEPYLSTNGGPIISVCIENEYCTFGNDIGYLQFIAEELRKNGIQEPLYFTDNTEYALRLARNLDAWLAINYRIESDTAIPLLRSIQPDKPPFVGEYWSGRAVYWGEDGESRQIEPIAKAYRTALDLGAYVCFYMFTGGTNFGFMNGSRVVKPFRIENGIQTPSGEGSSFHAITTSYNVDALVTEDGRATEKYYACRAELDAYLGKPVRTHRLPDPPAQAIEKVQLTECAPLFEQMDAVAMPTVHNAKPLSFERLDCPYGFVLYTTQLPGGFPHPRPLFMERPLDRAMIFANGEYKGTIQRDRPIPVIMIDASEPVRLDILVENMGRNNTRPEFPEEKGLLCEVKWGTMRVFGWDNTPLPMNDFSKLKFEPGCKTGQPAFFRGTFRAKAGVSTNLHTKGLGKGFAVINGFNLGRFWAIGPQESLYVPGALLHDGENELIIFELHTEAEAYANGAPTVRFIERPIFNGEYRDAII